MKLKLIVVFVFAILFSGKLDSLSAQEIPIRLPDGFQIEQFAGDDLATNIFALTINARGEVVVSGPGYIKTLLDTDSDGKADTHRLFSTVPKQGAQGLFFDGDDLYATGDGGLHFFSDANRDGIADGPPEKKISMKTGGEHDAHAIRRGPDGWLYVICGNGVPISADFHSGSNSPVKEPRAGFVMRISPDWKTKEIYAHGFRNAYDFDFDIYGNVITYDSDGERDISMPWYQPTRVFALRPGDDAGFVSPSWKRPSYYPGMPLEAARLGRGSPTGVVSYQHHQFPSEYFGATFVLDWTFGRIVSVQRRPKNVNVEKSNDSHEWTYVASEFAVAKDQFGFAPTDIEVAPDGSLYVAIGGRGTRGGVYRISYTDPAVKNSNSNISNRDENKGVDSSNPSFTEYPPQPLSSWGRKRIQDAKAQLSADALLRNVADKSLDLEVRLGAFQVLRETGLIKTFNQAVECFWSLKENPEAMRLQVEHFRLTQKMKRLAKADATYGIDAELEKAEIRWRNAQLAPFYAQEDALTVFGAKNAERQISRPVSRGELSTLLKFQQRFKLKKPVSKNVFTGYESEEGEVESADSIYPSADDLPIEFSETNNSIPAIRAKRELARLIGLAVSNDPSHALRENGADLLNCISPKSNPIDDIHFLICLAVIGPKLDSGQIDFVADALLQISPKIDSRKLNRDRNWPGHMRDIANRMIQNWPQLRERIVKHRLFGEPENVHLLFIANNEFRAEAERKVADVIRADPENESLIPAMIAFAGKQISEDESLLERLWQRNEFQSALLNLLSRKPQIEHQRRFVEGLGSPNVATVKRCATALIKLSPKQNESIIVACVHVLGRLGWDRNDQSTREQLIYLLRQQTSKEYGFVFGKGGENGQNKVISSWREYSKASFPETFQAVFKNENIAQWTQDMLNQTDWDAGDAGRGKQLYRSLSCARCHDGSKASGPRLEGVTKRFSRDELFRSITSPNDQVSSRYRSIVVETTEGEIVKGLVIYESVDGITLINQDNETVRIEQDEIDVRSASVQSIMPMGLLDKSTTQDWADLYEYLKSLN